MAPKEKRYQLFDSRHNCFISDTDTLNVVYNKGFIDSSLFEMLANKNDIKSINIYLDSVEKFNKLCSNFHFRIFRRKPINIIFKHINMDNSIDELNGLHYDEETTKLDTNKLPDNVTISYKKVTDYCVPKQEVELKDTESLSIDPWLVNVCNTTFEKFISKLDEDSRKYALFLRSTVKSVYVLLKHKYPNIDEMSQTEKMKIISDYVKNSIRLVDRNENTSDPVSTFIQKKGDTYGRSKLIQLLSNNKYLKVQSYCVQGCHNHYWNEYIDENGNIMELDPSDEVMPMTNIKSSSKLVLRHSNQIYQKMN